MNTIFKNENFFKIIVESSFDAIVITDPDGLILYVNPRWCELSGWSAKEVIGKVTPRIIKSGAKDQQFYAQLWETIKKGEMFRMDVTNKRKDGTLYTVDEIIIPLKTDLGVTRGFVGFQRDITDRQRVESKLRKSEERFRNLAESIVDAIISADESGEIIFWNRAAQKMFGYSKGEVLGKPLTILMPERYREYHKKGVARILAGGEPRIIGKAVEMIGVKKSGEEFPIELSLAMFKNNEIIFTSVIRDISERKRADDELKKRNAELSDAQKALVNLLEDAKELENKLRESRDRAEIVVSSMNEGLLVVRGDSKIEVFNKAAEKITGLEASKIIGQDFKKFFTPLKEGEELLAEECPISKTLKTGKPIDIRSEDNLYYKTLPDRIFPIAISTAPITGNGARGAVAVFRDITRAKNLEKAQIGFISLASHQLRTPLTSIKWISELLLRGDLGAISGEQKEFLGDLHTSVERMADLINSLLNISRIDSAQLEIKLEKVNIAELYQEIVEELQSLIKKKGHILILENPGNIKYIKTDKNILREILENLLSNAVKYTPNNGKLRLAISKKDDSVLFAVADKGLGIPKQEQSRVFERFFRAENVVKIDTTGTGLGLYIVKSLVKLLGGRIWFDSEEGKGTTFYFTVPINSIRERKGTKTLA